MKPGDVRAQDGLRAQDPEPHQRLGDAVLAGDEACEQDGRSGEDADHAAGAPAPLVALGDSEHKRGEAGGDEDRAGRVERLHAGVLALAEQDGSETEGHEGDRDVDEEDPLPRQGVGEDAAEEHARGGAEAADGAPDAERDVPLAAFGKGRHQDRERSRRDRGGAEALEGAGADQRPLGPREPAEERADRERDQADHEDAPAAEQVRGSPAQEQEAAEDERVGGDHPLQVRLGEVEIRLDRGKSDVHDRDVEHNHELDGAKERQCEPFQAR